MPLFGTTPSLVRVGERSDHTSVISKSRTSLMRSDIRHSVPILYGMPIRFNLRQMGYRARRFGGLAGLVAALRVDD